MILEKLNKVNLKKIIWLSSWILQVDKIARQPWVHGGWGVEVRGDDQREGREGGLGMAWGNRMGGMEEGWIWEQGSKYLN